MSTIERNAQRPTRKIDPRVLPATKDERLALIGRVLPEVADSVVTSVSKSPLSKIAEALAEKINELELVESDRSKPALSKPGLFYPCAAVLTGGNDKLRINTGALEGTHVRATPVLSVRLESDCVVISALASLREDLEIDEGRELLLVRWLNEIMKELETEFKEQNAHWGRSIGPRSMSHWRMWTFENRLREYIRQMEEDLGKGSKEREAPKSDCGTAELRPTRRC